MSDDRTIIIDPASFRDPCGFVYRAADGRLCRQINPCYEDTFRRFHECGLYQALTGAELLVAHETGDATHGQNLVIHPHEIPFISYPYEWSFSMLKDAALLTLNIQKRALSKGMSLKDASVFNVQFEGAKPIFIDTLSFTPLEEGEPWVAYGQFCRHFLAPLVLMSRRDVRLNRLLESFIDGVPLDLAARLLPLRTYFDLGLNLHLRMHAKSVARHQQTQDNATGHKVRAVRLSRKSLEQLIEHLEITVHKQRWLPVGTQWVDYYQDNTYTNAMQEQKAKWIGAKLDQLKPRVVWDLGANTGLYSRIARDTGAYVIAADIDPGCVEQNYLNAKKRSDRQVLPLLVDLTNPSPGLGWANRERRSFTERGPADAVLALALVHHLAVANNVPFEVIAAWFARLTRFLLIEFVPKDDPQTQRLLQSREDVFTHYTKERFEAALNIHFRKIEQQAVAGGERVLYLFENARNAAAT